jgi:hypothetical protein
MCTDPRDKVYSLRSIASDVKIEACPRPDYSKTRQTLCWDVLSFCIPKDITFPHPLLYSLGLTLQDLRSNPELLPSHDKGYEVLSNGYGRLLLAPTGSISPFKSTQNEVPDKMESCENLTFFSLDSQLAGVTSGRVKPDDLVYFTSKQNLALIMHETYDAQNPPQWP